MSEFSFTREQLKNLVRDRDSDSLARISDSGGIRGIAKKLSVDPDTGLRISPEILHARREAFGLNYVPPPKARSYLSFLIDAFGDLTIRILCVSALVDLGIAIGYTNTSSSYAESGAILVSIFVVTNVAAGNDYSKQAQFRKLNAQVENQDVIALRDGEKVNIKLCDVVVGEIVTVNVGDIICADGLLITGHGVEVDESSLTGEPKSVRKSVTENPFMLSGTKVMNGSGMFLVIAVGENSEAGQIKMIVQGGAPRLASLDESPQASMAEEGSGMKSILTEKLDRLSTRIGKMGTLIALICFIVMVVRFSVTTYAIESDSTHCAALESGSVCNSSKASDLNPNGNLWPVCGSPGSEGTCCKDTDAGAIIQGSPCPWLKVHLGEFIRFFITAITILVVAVPEGLPLAVTLSLAFSVMRMQKDKNLVKHLDACETMGSATIVCSDKTGTLTKNRMTVMRAFLGNQSFRPKGQVGVGLSLFGITESELLRFTLLPDGRRKVVLPASPEPLISLIAEGVSVNSTADIKWDPAVRLWSQIGNKTECALLQFISEFKVDYAQIRLEKKVYLVQAIPFNSTNKQSAAILRNPADGGYQVHIKGASEVVVGRCTSVMTRDGGTRELSLEQRKIVLDQISEYANLAMRTIAIAYKSINHCADWEDSSLWEDNLTLLAILGIEDPLRDEVPEAINKCRTAGVEVRMVTGDNLDTAIAIAKGCGILRLCDCDVRGFPNPNTAMTGSEFRSRVLLPDGSINRSEFDIIAPHLRVLARSSPTDKYTLVSGLLCEGQEKDQVVAVTGDGTNDAPALKRADVGFAMGITGTAVAKEAADIILMDDNFSSIVKAIVWGRNVYESISKFLQFQLTINIVALVLAIEGAVTAAQSPLNAVQMLWVNLIMDSLASLALATEPPTEEHLNRPPVSRRKGIISTIMVWNISGHVVYQLVVLNVLLFAGPEIFGFKNALSSSGNDSPSEHNTLIFNSFLLIQLANQINMRKLHHEASLFKGLLVSRFFLIILLIEISFQILIIEFGGTYFHTKPLSLTSWIVGIVLALLVFPVQLLIILIASISKRLTNRLKRKSLELVPFSVNGDADKEDQRRPSFKSQKSDDSLLNQVVSKNKRNESCNSMAKAFTRRGDNDAKKEFSRIGQILQTRRQSNPFVLHVV